MITVKSLQHLTKQGQRFSRCNLQTPDISQDSFAEALQAKYFHRISWKLFAFLCVCVVWHLHWWCTSKGGLNEWRQRHQSVLRIIVSFTTTEVFYNVPDESVKFMNMVKSQPWSTHFFFLICRVRKCKVHGKPFCIFRWWLSRGIVWVASSTAHFFHRTPFLLESSFKWRGSIFG